jgi:hypothetical protein
VSYTTTLPLLWETFQKTEAQAKAFSSVRQEKDVRKIVDRIQRYQISLIHYQTTPHPLVLPSRIKPLFTVPFAQDPRFMNRRCRLKSLDEHFEACRRSRVSMA